MARKVKVDITSEEYHTPKSAAKTKFDKRFGLVYLQTTMPEETVETSQPVQTAGSKSTNWTKIILAAVLGFGLLAGSAYAGYYYGTQQVQQSEKPAPVVSQPRPEADRPLDETPKPTPTEVSEGWEPYQNLTDNYSVMIPNNWSASETEVEGPAGSARETYFGEIGQRAEDFIVIVVRDNPEDLSIKEWTEQEYQDVTGGLEPEGDTLKYVDDVVGGVGASKVTGIPARFADVQVFISHGGKMFKILGITDPAFGKVEAFDQILATFKFLD